jgi:alpha-D-ribose 1-methylphosphonate 5-triphosphate synthase subunit PhnG
MFHAFDNDVPGKANPRALWMALLSRAPLNLLEAALGPHLGTAPHWLRPPETGLMMVQGRAGATGERFNLGELTLTRCALRLGSSAAAGAHVGVAYVLGRSHRQAQLAATADALLQDPTQREALDTELLHPVRELLARQSASRHARAQSSKVEFFTVAREAGGADDAQDNA